MYKNQKGIVAKNLPAIIAVTAITLFAIVVGLLA
ncbi:hypothetical protein PEDI_00680 [Persicobacter diffluens]|uniref:Uncharacterized protein n=1 Tax=Persicobacter diffluens TaxID=981 RepID=A0AAN5AJJ2_9BACT|nr:hypothetical protein PEDI_00680 [Persicobacter diffluens]